VNVKKFQVKLRIWQNVLTYLQVPVDSYGNRFLCSCLSWERVKNLKQQFGPPPYPLTDAHVHDQRWGSEQRPIEKLKALRLLRLSLTSTRFCKKDNDYGEKKEYSSGTCERTEKAIVYLCVKWTCNQYDIWTIKRIPKNMKWLRNYLEKSWTVKKPFHMSYRIMCSSLPV